MRRLLPLAAIGLLLASVLTDWPWAHTFATYGWPGPFGWVARNTPGNVVAGFIQVGLGVVGGYVAHRVGVFERLKDWALKETGEHDRWVAEQIAEIHRRTTGHEPDEHPLHGKI